MKAPTVLAVIHARGGSKRIPLKNLVKLGGKPLLAYPIRLAKSSKYISRIVLSTDHDGIMETGRRYGAEVPFRRPKAISKDVPSELVTLHAIRYLRAKENYVPDIVVTLTPATPFTRVADIDKGIVLLIKHPGWDAVVTVQQAKEYPHWMLWENDKTQMYRTILGNRLDGKYNVSQNLPRAYYPAGAFYINRTRSLLAQKSLYGNKFGAVELNGLKNIDLDTPDDLIRARALLKRRG